MKVQVAIDGLEEPIELELESVRHHMAHTACGRAYCLDDGALYCHAELGERLTAESLATCQDMEKQHVGRHLLRSLCRLIPTINENAYHQRMYA